MRRLGQTKHERETNMTNADITQINSLLACAASLTDAIDEANRGYHDERIAQYAEDAIKDYAANKLAIAQIVKDNFGLFFPDSLISLGEKRRLYVGRGESFTVSLGCDVDATIRLVDFETVKGDEWKTTYRVKSLDVLGVRFYVSDSGTAEYGICSAWDLVDYRHGIDLDKYERTATEWRELYERAYATRRKNEILVRRFKEALSARTDALRARANALEATRRSVDNLNAEYRRVSI